ncbi:MAG: CotH kinase family protein [Alistipes sp.]|nr:CotH kinase family protein [Alistipes sp.]
MKRIFNLLAILLISSFALISCGGNELVLPNNEYIEQPVPEFDVPAGEDGSLPGAIIGTKYSVDYGNGDAQSTTVNTKANVFDRKFNTYFASYDRSMTWVGLDLGEKHIITKIGYAPRSGHADRVQLAVIEGANRHDFEDAVPIYLIPEAGTPGQMNYATVNCSRGFRYVRYVSPNDERCNLAELAFYGTKGEGDDSQFFQVTNLPTVVIRTEKATEVTSKEYEISSTVYVISDDGKKVHIGEKTGIRGRGNASWGFAKKPYRLKFDKKVQLLDAPAEAKKWTLLSNHSDKSLMRNILAFEISRRVGAKYTPYCQPVDVIFNGEYRGCYQLCDQIDVREGRVDITEMKPEDNTGDALTGGYLIEIDANATKEKCYFWSNKGIPVTIKSPDDEKITAQQKKYIEDCFNNVLNKVFSDHFTHEDWGYYPYFDIDSFLKHFIVGEISGNTDTYWSVYMYKERGDQKLYTGPVWDFDIAFDNDKRTTYELNNPYGFHYASANASAAGGDNLKNFVTRIVTGDPVANARLKEMWADLRNSGTISSESLVQYVNDTEALLDQSQKLNFKRWNILNSVFHENFQALGSYEAEVGTVRKYINNRIHNLDAIINK